MNKASCGKLDGNREVERRGWSSRLVCTRAPRRLARARPLRHLLALLRGLGLLRELHVEDGQQGKHHVVDVRRFRRQPDPDNGEGHCPEEDGRPEAVGEEAGAALAMEEEDEDHHLGADLLLVLAPDNCPAPQTINQGVR